MSRRNDSGMVTAELALASLLVAVALLVVCWAGNLGLIWLHCLDSASAIARQEARGDLVAVAEARSVAPAASDIVVHRTGSILEVTVSVTTKPWGGLLPAVPVIGKAHVRTE